MPVPRARVTLPAMSRAASRIEQSSRWVALGLIAVVGLVLYARSLSAWYWGIDDFKMLADGRTLLQQGPLAALRAHQEHFESLGQVALRPAQIPLWSLDLLIGGTAGWASFATNLALHIGCAVLIGALALRLGLGPVAAFAAGLLFVGHVGSTEVVYILIARSSSLALLLVLAVAVAWPRLRSTPRGALLAGAVMLVAMFSKVTAVLLPALLLVLDGLEDGWKPTLRPSRRMAWRYGPLVAAIAAWLAVAAALYGASGVLDYPRTMYSPAGPVVAFLTGCFDQLVAPTWRGPSGLQRALDTDYLPRLLIVNGLLLWGLSRRTEEGRVARAGLLLLAVGLIAPAGMLARGVHFGRHFLEAQVGLSLAFGASVAALRGPRLQVGAAAAAALALIGSWFVVGVPAGLAAYGKDERALVDALNEAPEADRRAVLLTLPRIGVLDLLSTPEALELVTGSSAPIYVGLAGVGLGEVPPSQAGVQRAACEVHVGGWEVLREPGTHLVVEVIDERGARFVSATEQERAALVRPDLRIGAPLWRASPTRQGDWSVASVGPIEGRGEPLDDPSRWPADAPGRLAGPVLSPDASQGGDVALIGPTFGAGPACGLEVELQPDVGSAQFWDWGGCWPGGRDYGLLWWAADGDLSRPDGVLTLPRSGADGPERTKVDLRRVPGWPTASSPGRLAILPSAAGQPMLVTGVSLAACGEGT